MRWVPERSLSCDYVGNHSNQFIAAIAFPCLARASLTLDAYICQHLAASLQTALCSIRLRRHGVWRHGAYFAGNGCVHALGHAALVLPIRGPQKRGEAWLSRTGHQSLWYASWRARGFIWCAWISEASRARRKRAGTQATITALGGLPCEH